MSERINLWEDIGNACLAKAKALLADDSAPTAASVEAVSKLVHIAIDIDMLNLRWALQSRYASAVFRVQASLRQEGGN